jgi:hypothetical protein
MLEDNCHLAVFAKVVPNSFKRELHLIKGASAYIIDVAKFENACLPAGPKAFN